MEEDDDVTAYIIVEVETTDEDLMAEYRKHTPGLVGKFGGKFVVRGGKTRTLEGGWTPARIVVPSASAGSSVQPAGRKTMIVDPCSNQPISAPAGMGVRHSSGRPASARA